MVWVHLNRLSTENLAIAHLDGKGSLSMATVPHKSKSLITLGTHIFYHPSIQSVK